MKNSTVLAPISDAAKREMIIELALNEHYSKDDLSYISKNSNFSATRAMNHIANHHIGNETMKRLFVKESTKIIKK